MAAKKTPAQKTWTPQALQAFANAYLAKGNAPTPQMIAGGQVKAVQTPNPPAQPFLTGDQLLSQADSHRERDERVQDLLSQLAQGKLQASFSRQAIDRGRVQGVANAQDSAAARGIFQSSIKDGQIYDINAQAATQQQQLNDQLQALQSTVASRINLLDEALRRSAAAFHQMAAENASQIQTGFSTSYVPTAVTPAPAAPRTPSAAPRATGGQRQPLSGSRRLRRR